MDVMVNENATLTIRSDAGIVVVLLLLLEPDSPFAKCFPQPGCAGWFGGAAIYPIRMKPIDVLEWVGRSCRRGYRRV